MSTTRDAVSYQNYIHPHRLPPAEPLGDHNSNPDQRFFIRTHQAFEIWFDHLISELTFARDKLSKARVSEDDIPLIAHHLQRTAMIFGLLKDHLPLLETLLTRNFFDFRRELFGAGGVESHRFREVEWLLGFRDNDLFVYVEEKTRREPANSAAQRELESLQDYRRFSIERLKKGTRASDPRSVDPLVVRDEDIKRNGSLRQQVFQWLRRTPYPAEYVEDPVTVLSAVCPPKPGPEYGNLFASRFRQRFEREFVEDLRQLREHPRIDTEKLPPDPSQSLSNLDWFMEQSERRATLFILQFADSPLLAWPASVLEALLEVDEAFLTWRDRHIAMVARVLGGGRISTMGDRSSGLAYLRRTLDKRAFSEIWDAREFLLGKHEAEGLYNDYELKPFRLMYEGYP